MVRRNDVHHRPAGSSITVSRSSLPRCLTPRDPMLEFPELFSQTSGQRSMLERCCVLLAGKSGVYLPQVLAIPFNWQDRPL